MSRTKKKKPIPSIKGKIVKANRRSFLGLFGAAAVAGPNAVKSANINVLLDAPVGGIVDGMSSSYPSDKGWAKNNLKKLLGKTAEQRQRELARTSVYQLDPNVASLRSVSLTGKMRFSKHIIYAREEEKQIFDMEGIINDWW